jgi:small subunit ribosomal protein S1
MTSAKASNKSPTFSMEDFAQALEQQDNGFQVGQKVTGKVHTLEPAGVYIDIGAKSLAFVPIDEVSLSSAPDLEKILPPDSEHEFLIIREQDADGQLTLSRRRLQMDKIWAQLQTLQEGGQTLSVRVTGTNKGGVTVGVKGLRGFIPRSHLVERENLDELVGQSLTVSLLEVDRDRKKLVCSQRVAARAASMSQFEIGQLIEGQVTGIRDFGVFVEFEGVTALLPITQISNHFVKSISDHFSIGQTLKAVILDRDEARGRMSLSTKVLENSAGEMIDGRMASVMEQAEARAEKWRQKEITVNP